MGFRFRTFEQAQENHPECYIDIRDRKLDENFPKYEEMPVASFPAIYVYDCRDDSDKDPDGENMIAIYWLKEDW